MATTTVKPLCKIPTTCFPSRSTTFTAKSVLYPCSSIRSRPVSLCSYISLPLIHLHGRQNKRNTFSSRVAQTSDWAQQGEEGDSPSLTALQDLEQEPLPEHERFSWDGGEVSEPEASLSDWKESDGDAVAEGAAGDVDAQGDEEGFPEPPEEAKLFVGNLPYDIDSEKLAQLFEPAGIVEISEVIYNRETDQSRGFGFVTMSTVEEAEKAVEMFNRYDLNGRFLTVNKAAPRGSRPERPVRSFEPSFRVYVGNLPWDLDSARLEEVFSEYGSVVSARVVSDRDTGRSRGFGFVTMANETEMNDAIAALDGQSLDGRTVRVNVAEERPRRNF